MIGYFCPSWRQREEFCQLLDYPLSKMVKGKLSREKGKIKLSNYFKKIEEGAHVAIIRDVGVSPSFPKRIQGRRGIVLGSRGRSKLVSIKDGNKKKTFIIHPVHLRGL